MIWTIVNYYFFFIFEWHVFDEILKQVHGSKLLLWNNTSIVIVVCLSLVYTIWFFAACYCYLSRNITATVANECINTQSSSSWIDESNNLTIFLAVEMVHWKVGHKNKFNMLLITHIAQFCIINLVFVFLLVSTWITSKPKNISQMIIVEVLEELCAQTDCRRNCFPLRQTKSNFKCKKPTIHF